MAQKASQQQRFIAERVRALAIVYLTRRPEVAVHEPDLDSGVDLLVTLHPEDRQGLRRFGLKLAGVWGKVTASHANAVLRPSVQKTLRYGPFAFPVVLFFFTMENNQGWYAWVAEPVISDDGAFELRPHEDASCRPLDNQAVDEIITLIDRWYDAFFVGITAPRRRK